MNKYLLWIVAIVPSLALPCIAPLAAQSQAGGLAHVHLRMSADEFFTQYPRYDRQSACQDTAKGIMECGVQEVYLSVGLIIRAEFIDQKLAEIIIGPPQYFGDCFAEPDPTQAQPAYQQERTERQCSELHYTQLLASLTNVWGSPTVVQPGNQNKFHPFHALRWENDRSIAEFENPICGPYPRDKAITELLASQYCQIGDPIDGSHSEIIFLDKDLGRMLAARLAGA
jgi:hypothetical protein